MRREHEAARGTHEAVADLILGPGGCRRVLDIPCGSGAFLRRLDRAGLEVHGADLVKGLEVPGARFRQADMSSPLPYPDGSFDAITCIEGLEHIERPFDFVRECHRILRPGGTLVVSTPNASSLRSRWRWLLTGFHNKCKIPLDETDPSPLHHVNMMSLPELRYLLHTCGFRLAALRTNRIKPISWVYAPWVPLAWLVTAHVFRREEKDPVRRRRNREIARDLFRPAVLFGETLIAAARRAGAPLRKGTAFALDPGRDPGRESGREPDSRPASESESELESQLEGGPRRSTGAAAPAVD